MTRERLVKWLDKQVEICKLAHSVDVQYLRESEDTPTYAAFTGAYGFGYENEVSIRYIENVAELLGDVELVYEPFPSEIYPTKAYFFYNEVKFSSLLDREVTLNE